MSIVQQHFDKEAAQYDYWKKRNWYYYNAIKNIYEERIPANSSVLEIGCGTGDILAHVCQGRCVGIDISSEMIEIAKQKYSEFAWYACTVSDLYAYLDETFDVVFLSDVIEHLEDVDSTFRDCSRFCHNGTRLIINMANPLWEPILLILEKFKMKMPEGPHRRISVKTLSEILKRYGFHLQKRSFRLLFPKHIPLLSRFFNLIGRLPVIRRLCLIEILEYRLI